MLLEPGVFVDFLSAGYVVGLETHEIGRVAKILTQWCTSWRFQHKACARSPGVNPRVIICLLDDVVLGVQAPR